MIKITKKSQSFSIDIALAVIVFIAAFFIFYAILSSNPSSKVTSLKKDASIVIKQVASEDAPLRIVDKNEINITKVDELKDLSYEELKRRLRIDGDFCIYLEDEKGNVILIGDKYKGIGSPNINIGGTPCSAK